MSLFKAVQYYAVRPVEWTHAKDVAYRLAVPDFTGLHCAVVSVSGSALIIL